MSDIESQLSQVKYPQLLGKQCDKFKIGAHYSITKGFEQILSTMQSQGATAAAFFTAAPRGYNLTMGKSESMKAFNQMALKLGYTADQFIAHSPYVINVCSERDDVREKSYLRLLLDAYTVRMMGLNSLNFHPGSNPIIEKEELQLQQISEAINKIHMIVSDVIMVLECMAGSKSGSVKGCSLKQISAIINMVVDKQRVGVTIDTCHVYTGEFVSKEKFFINLIKEFDSVVGREFLTAFHLNDSIPDYGAHVDRHENIGKGTIGLQGFKDLFSHQLIQYPYVLETPNDSGDYRNEIQLIHELWKSQQ